MQRSLFYPQAERETLTTREESTAVSPQRRVCCCTICGSHPFHPPSSLSVSSSHVGWMNQEIGELFGVRVEAPLIRGAAQATPSLFEQLAPCCRVRKVTLRSKLILGLPFVSSWNLPALLFSLTLTYPITMHNGIWIFNEETHSSSYNSLMFHASRGGTDHCISCYISLKVLFLSDR